MRQVFPSVTTSHYSSPGSGLVDAASGCVLVIDILDLPLACRSPLELWSISACQSPEPLLADRAGLEFV